MRASKLTPRFILAQQQTHQIVIRQLQQTGQRIHFFVAQLGLMCVKKTRKDEVILQQAAPAAPAQSCPARRVILMPDTIHGIYTARLTSSSLIFPIALFGLSPFGQTSTQFMIE